MKKENINNLSEEIRKIKFRVDYKINETPKYRPLIDTNEEFDEIPQLTGEAGKQEDAPAPAGTPAKTPVPAFDKTGGEAPAPEGGEMPTDLIDSPKAADQMGAAPETGVNDIQNEIIKHNIEAMKSIHDQLEGLNSMVQEINTKIEELNVNVEEVREPTNTEKLMNKTSVSYPYYFNLNDFWQGNWFNQKREKELDKGIKELPDGTFVADFDDLPHKSNIDIQNSFNETI